MVKNSGIANLLQLAPHNIAILYFQETHDIDGDMLEKILENIDYAEYWNSFIKTTFSDSYINIVNKSIQNENNAFFVLDKKQTMGYFDTSMVDMYKKSPFFTALNTFASLKLFCFFKDRGKKSFPRVKFDPEIELFVKKRDKTSFASFMLQKFPNEFRSASSLCVKLEDLWSNHSIICLDCDQIVPLFQKKEPRVIKLLAFLCDAKENGLVVFSSPTNSPFDRFKVFVKITDFFGSYKEIQTLVQNSEVGQFFKLEQFASVFGNNMDGQMLIPTNTKTHVELSINALLTLTETYSSSAHTSSDLIVRFFEERSSCQRLCYKFSKLDQKNFLQWMN